MKYTFSRRRTSNENVLDKNNLIEAFHKAQRAFELVEVCAREHKEKMFISIFLIREAKRRKSEEKQAKLKLASADVSFLKDFARKIDDFFFFF